jgi:5S rRNA maturation endonuclease (ribonuclease M5)
MENLDGKIEAIAEFFFGKATKITDEELRFGSQGSKSLDRINKRYYDHQEEKGGNVITLIQENIADGYKPGNVSKFLAEHFGEDVRQGDDLSILRRTPAAQHIEATYEYEKADGAVAYIVTRMGPQKTFWQKLPDGRKPKDDPDFVALPFHLPRLLKNPDATVFIVEGEKDVLTLEAHGLVATCNHGGSGAWKECHAEWLASRRVVILPDNDAPGREHGNKIAGSLKNKASAIKLINLAGLPDKGDVTDWLECNSINDLKEIVRASNMLAVVETPLPVMSIEQVIDMPAVHWLIQDLIPENSLTMLYGASGSGKTFLILSILCSIAHGKDWFGRGAQQGCCVLVAGEGVGGLRKRLLAYHKAHDLGYDAPLYIIPRAVNLMQQEEVDDLIETIEIRTAGVPVKMIVFDTLARSMHGDADENSSQAMGQAIAEMDRVKTHFGCAVVPVHHTGKDNDRSRGGRGSSALIGALDTSIFVARHEGDLVEVDVQKQKDGEQKPPLWFRSQKVLVQREWHDDVEDSIVLEMCDEKPAASKSKSLSPSQSRILEALNEALIRHGTVPNALEGATWVCVTEEQWRAVALDMTISQSGEEADKKAFRRGAQALIEKGRVEKRSNLVWNVDMAVNKTKIDDYL